LNDAATFELVGLKKGSTVLEFEAPPLKQQMPEKFRQQDLFLPFVNPDHSCLDFLEESIEAAVTADEDSELYDEGLIKTLESFSKLLGSGVEKIERAQTPQPRQVRIAGILDEIRHSDRMFSLILESEERVRGVATGVERTQLAKLFGKPVLVSGEAHFRPSGKPLRVEATAIQAVDGNASMWSTMPKPLMVPADARRFHQPQGPRSGLNAIIGKWPGSESDDEISRALEEIS
jgi:hypothetical protein